MRLGRGVGLASGDWGAGVFSGKLTTSPGAPSFPLSPRTPCKANTFSIMCKWR